MPSICAEPKRRLIDQIDRLVEEAYTKGEITLDSRVVLYLTRRGMERFKREASPMTSHWPYGGIAVYNTDFCAVEIVPSRRTDGPDYRLTITYDALRGTV